MTAIPAPQGINESDYDSIESAVTETVRGRWFLNEFARRTRAAETQLLLQAMARLEHAVASNSSQIEPPSSADPSIRMLVQRIKEIAGHLEATELAMRQSGADERFCEAVGTQARAVAGLMRAGSVPKINPPEGAPKADLSNAGLPNTDLPNTDLPKPELAKPELAKPEPAPPAVAAPLPVKEEPQDPRLPFFSGLNRLTLAQKTALFT